MIAPNPATLRAVTMTDDTIMSTNLESLQAQVLRLSFSDRATLLDRLIASLDVDAEAESAWDDLAERREKELRVGTVEAVPVAEVIARLDARFPG